MRIKRAIGAVILAAAATGASVAVGTGTADAAPAAGSQACVNNVGVGIFLRTGVKVVQPHQCSTLFPAGYYKVQYATGGYEYLTFPAGRTVALR